MMLEHTFHEHMKHDNVAPPDKSPHLLEFSAWAVCFFLIRGRVWKHSKKHCRRAFLEFLNSFA